MRERKFRVWFIREKKFIYFTDKNSLNNSMLGRYFNGASGTTAADIGNAVVQDFTGLTDKNGKEIYEGDIVIYRNKNREIRIGQFWNGEDDRVGCFIQDPMVTHRNFGTSRVSAFEKCEIIGNIFENPELLKQ
jgi:uncharacterized phage protein (TIGR01671 family)